MAKSPLMPVSASMVLSIARSINEADRKKQVVEFCEKNDIVMYVAQADIDLLKPMLTDASTMKLGPGAAKALSRDTCKDKGG